MPTIYPTNMITYVCTYTKKVCQCMSELWRDRNVPYLYLNHIGKPLNLLLISFFVCKLSSNKKLYLSFLYIFVSVCVCVCVSLPVFISISHSVCETQNLRMWRYVGTSLSSCLYLSLNVCMHAFLPSLPPSQCVYLPIAPPLSLSHTPTSIHQDRRRPA